MSNTEIAGTPYVLEHRALPALRDLAQRVQDMRSQGSLSPAVLYRIRKHFRIKDIYHSNAIEGNVLAVGETRQVVELGLTITGKPLRDQAEARNLSEALDFLEELAKDVRQPITERDVRQLHDFVLKGLHVDAGRYRSVPVTISGSKFPPPQPESVPSQMEEFGHWLSEASKVTKQAFADVSGLLAAAAAHTSFVTIHPFIDGNGRVARLLMNLMLMRHGFPIAIITKEDRVRYYEALEDSQSSDLTPFVTLLSECIDESLDEYLAAAKEQREQLEWATSLTEKFAKPERIRAQNDYEVWKNAMELLKSYFRQIVDTLDRTYFGNVYFKDFGNLEFEKYSALRHGQSAKKTWSFRLDFRRGEKTARYLLFFGQASHAMRAHCNVTLHVAREEPANSFYYERLDNVVSQNIPDVAEIGYDIHEERFVVRGPRRDRPRFDQVENVARRFFEDVIERHFA